MVLIVTGAMLMAFSASLYAEDAPPGPPPPMPVTDLDGALEIPLEHADPGFDEYANAGMLATAWHQMDPGLVTDIALRFAEGERVLMRSHKTITTGQAFDLAIRVATEKRDKATLARLAKALEKSGDRARLEQVNLSMKVAGTARASDPTLQEGTPEELDVIRKFQFKIEAARIDGNGDALKQFETELADALIKDKQRAALKKLIQEARDALPDKEQGEVLELMSKVGGASRQVGGATRTWYDGQPDYFGTLRWGKGLDATKNNEYYVYYRENFWVYNDRIFVVNWHPVKNANGTVKVVVDSGGKMLMRQSSEYVRVLWNPQNGPNGWRKLESGQYSQVHSTDRNSVRFYQTDGKWSNYTSLTQLMELGTVSGNQITISLPANIVAAGGGNIYGGRNGIVAAGGGNAVSNGIVAAGGGNLVPRYTNPHQYFNADAAAFADLPGKK